MVIGALPFPFATFGQGTGVILLANVQCNGTESTLLACPSIRSEDGIDYCDHSNDAGVKCLGKKHTKP